MSLCLSTFLGTQEAFSNGKLKFFIFRKSSLIILLIVSFHAFLLFFLCIIFRCWISWTGCLVLFCYLCFCLCFFFSRKFHSLIFEYSYQLFYFFYLSVTSKNWWFFEWSFLQYTVLVSWSKYLLITLLRDSMTVFSRSLLPA